MTYKEHGGDIYRNRIESDFSINVNPLGMPEHARQALRESISDWSVYPDPGCDALRAAIAAKLEIPAEDILCGNGAAELIYQLVWAIRPKHALLPVPAFSEYARALRTVSCEITAFPMRPEEDFRLDTEAFLRCIRPGIDLVFLCNPNNPNGRLLPEDEVMQIAEVCRKNGTVLVLDECFIELADPVRTPIPSCVTLRAFTKSYAMAGLRLGYMITKDAGLRDTIAARMQPWSVSRPAQIAGEAALQEPGYLDAARELIVRERSRMMGELRRMGLHVFSSDANYLLFYSECKDLYDRLLEQRILIRDCADYAGLGPGYYRVCVKTEEENERLLREMERLLK